MYELSDFDYALPDEAIAQNSVEPRDASKLMVLSGGSIQHRFFRDLPSLLSPGDLLVANNARVTALRLFGERQSGGKVEALLLRKVAADTFEALAKPAKRLHVGSRVLFDCELRAEIVEQGDGGLRVMKFDPADDLDARLAHIGRVPLPPYIRRTDAADERYQTIYAVAPGSSAAPTAGLHFTPGVIAALIAHEIAIASVTLDVGIDTFRPVQTDAIDDHKMHGERYSIPPETAATIRSAKGRVIAVGTTTVRALETASVGTRNVRAGSGCSSLFIRPGYEFQTVDAMITNFHMPRTTMLFMVAAMCGRDALMSAYKMALRSEYRFLSFGDAMLVLDRQ